MSARALTRFAAWVAAGMVATTVLAQPVVADAAGPIAQGAAIIGVTNEQTDGTIWVLSGSGSHRSMTKVDVTTGTVELRQSVSPQASSIAQGLNGGLVVGTANGRSSAVVLYDGANGAFLGAVPMHGSITNVAIAANGSITYAVEARGRSRMLETFDISRAGFPYHLSSTTVAVVPIVGGGAIWVLGSDSSLYKLHFFPLHVDSRLGGAAAHGLSLTLSPNGFFLYVLEEQEPGRPGVVRVYTPRGLSTHRIAVPAGSTTIDISSNGNTLFDAVNTSRGGEVEEIPVR